MTGDARLARNTLETLPDGVGRPGYDRAAQTVGIVHVGVGGFHRAHMAMALDTLMNAGHALDWAVCGVGLLPGDRRMQETLDAQDGLYTLIVKHPDGRREARVIGSIARYLFAPDDPDAVIEAMADPAVRIVSMTITEGGYGVDPATRVFDATIPDVVADLRDGAVPSTVFGFVAEALRRRRSRGIPPFTVLSCDNIQGNGRLALIAFTSFAALKDPELAAWMSAEVRFPDSMVDRITPVTSPADIAEAAAITGLRDAWPVVCEPFFQWVIEDDFGDGRPPFDEVGAQFVHNVEPYELMKLRLLNAGHQALCYLGVLAGYRFAHEAIADPAIAAFVRRYMDAEATPTLKAVPGIDLEEYKDTLIVRFGNPEVRDTLARLCAESSDRIPTFVLPVVRAQLASGGEIACSAGIVASWARYAEGVDERGEPIEVVDPLRERVMESARRQGEDPLAFVRDSALFGDLADDDRFARAYSEALGILHAEGALHTAAALASPRVSSSNGTGLTA